MAAFLTPLPLPVRSSFTSPNVSSRLPTPSLPRSISRPFTPTMVIQEDVQKEVEQGDPYISKEALEKMRTGNKFEKIKLKKSGATMWTEIHELSALLRAGETKWEDLAVDDIETRLKWVGLFHRRKRTPGRFMMRLKVPNGILNADQLRYFSSVLRPYGEDGCTDITTRMNIQLRGVTLDDASDIANGLYDIGLTSFMSGMDNVRNMVGSPIAGIDPLEMVDTRSICIDINNMITDNRKGRPELSNLPRKFNICVSGGRDDFAHTHINDVGLVPMKHSDTGEIGFNVVIGGFFSIKRNAEAIPMDVWIPQSDAVKFCEDVLVWFRDNGDRKNRQKTRLMYMVDKLTMDGFRQAIEIQFGSLLARAMPEGPEYATPFQRRNVLGVHPQKQAGLSWVGACVPAGRLSNDDLDQLADVADKYSNGEVRLTVEQNVIFPNIPNERIEEMSNEPLFSRFLIRPGRISGGLVSCTGSQFCGLALIETKNRAIALAEVLDRTLDVPRDVRLHWTGCPNSCGQVQVADIGLMGSAARKNGKAVEGVKIFVGGKIGEAAELGEQVAKGIPTDFEDLVPAVTDILVEQFGATVKA